MVLGAIHIVYLRTHMKLHRHMSPIGRPADALARVLRIPGTLVFPKLSR